MNAPSKLVALRRRKRAVHNFRSLIQANRFEKNGLRDVPRHLKANPKPKSDYLILRTAEDASSLVGSTAGGLLT